MSGCQGCCIRCCICRCPAGATAIPRLCYVFSVESLGKMRCGAQHALGNADTFLSQHRSHPISRVASAYPRKAPRPVIAASSAVPSPATLLTASPCQRPMRVRCLAAGTAGASGVAPEHRAQSVPGRSVTPNRASVTQRHNIIKSASTVARHFERHHYRYHHRHHTWYTTSNASA